MGSLKTILPICRSTESISGPRISFSDDFLDEKRYISTSPISQAEKKEKETAKERFKNVEFEFLSSNLATETMLTADELFFEGKLLPFRQMHHCEKINKLSLKADQQTEMRMNAGNKEEPKMSCFLDDDPSPRPPKCSVLWKELLRLRKKRSASTLSPSLSTSSSSSSGSISDVHLADEGKNGTVQEEKHVRKIKKGLERTKSDSFRIRPIVNVPVCTQGKNSSTHLPQFSLKKERKANRKMIALVEGH